MYNKLEVTCLQDSQKGLKNQAEGKRSLGRPMLQRKYSVF